VISIDINNLLWSTRGKEWGFRFIHTPLDHSKHWEAIYLGIFGKDDRVPIKWRGIVVFPNGSLINYIACRCFDYNRSWKDAAGREIPHEMFIEIDGPVVDEIAISKWELPVLDFVRDRYEDVYGKEVGEIVPISFRPEQRVLIPKSGEIVNSIRLDLDLRLPQGKANPYIPSACGRSIPLRRNIWKILNTDVKEIPTKIKNYLDDIEK
jgi:hypothetical protein